MPRMTVGDCQLFVERHGAGFPVLLLSGLQGLASYWRDQTPVFAKEFSVVLHDQRGVGSSDHVKMKYTVEKMALDVIQLMDTLEIPRAHIVGHSTGGAIAQVLALDHPGRVAGLVLAGTWPKPDPFFRRNFILRREILSGLGPAAYVSQGTIQLYPPAWIAEHNEALRGQEAQLVAHFPPSEIMLSRIDAILAFDRSADLPKIKAPTLVVGAADDYVTPSHYAETLARAIPNAELKLFPAGGHAVAQVKARDFNAAVLPFLKANTPA
jgi:aminoacrylate hydrolase